jgi:alkylation response protein AidB-like acyl-CoA dehydrogenase
MRELPRGSTGAPSTRSDPETFVRAMTESVLLGALIPKEYGAWASAIASGQLRLQAFGVTEPDAGTDTIRLTTSVVR